MDKIQKTSSQLVFSEAEKQLAVQIFHVNQLSPWKLSDLEIIEWTKTILDICPDATPEKIKDVIDRYKTNEIEWNTHQGVQNIIRILKPRKHYFL